MMWKETKSWAKEQGYKTDRTKITGEENSYHYTWSMIDDPNISGIATSVSKVATAIFNHITDNAHLEHQQLYIENQAKQDIKHETEGWR
jgi:hypothetical protein